MILREIKNIFIKNRLTEGVDFKRYEWLKADIPISTSMMSLPLNSKNFEFKRNWIQVMNSSYFWTYENSYPSYVYHLSDISTNERNPRIWNSKTSSLVYRSPIVVGLGIHTITANDSGIIISSATNTATLPWYGDGTTTTVVFNNANNINKNTIHLTSSIKVDGVVRYVPCQLLKPIPATLDANNKARAAGECGMYDSISGKFYGNVASTGTFTVEGEVEPETHTGLQQIYQNKLIEGVDYETYDWLKGDGTAYIDTKVTDLSMSDYINTEFQITEEDRTSGKRLFGHLGENTVRLTISCLSGRITVWGKSSSWQIVRADNNYKFNFDLVNNMVKDLTHNQSKSLTLHHGTLSNGFSLFLCRSYTPCYSKFKSFEIHDQINLVPCQLLHSIPRNLDAQCKERVAGECGMIDLISGKFYGNVDNSGTFTVENDTENNE